MNYLQAQEYLENLNTRGIKPGLESVSSLAAAMGNPQTGLKVIHVAGTNGKGSISSYIANILQENGYRVGTYQSPAVFNPTEIIQINNKNVTQKLFAETVTKMKDVIDSKGDLMPTRFEFETVMAFTVFAQKKCDFAVVECGMGGRLDATNIVTDTLVSVFAPIGMDHMSYLGNSLPEIAANKAGIIKKNSFVVSAVQQEEVRSVLEESAKENNSQVRFADFSAITNVRRSLKETKFTYKEYKDIQISLLGINQPENAAVAIEAAKAVNEAGFAIDTKKMIAGLHKTILPGRFELISKHPYFILDGAHNVPAALRLRENIVEYFNNRKIIFILSMLKDKEYDKVVQIVCPLAGQIITATSPNKSRALDAYELAETVYKINNMVTNVDSIDEAVELAYRIADKDTVIIAWGSLSHLCQVRKSLSQLNIGLLDNHGIED